MKTHGKIKGWMARLGVVAALGCLTLGANTGCGSKEDPVDRVQVGYIKKADLIGDDPSNPVEWYMQNTVTDVRRTNNFTFPGMQDTLKRVRWDIQENYLIARRSYEVVSGSDGKGASTIDPTTGQPVTLNDGIVVAMYPISKHFDIKYDYDTTSGETRNVLVENDTDRLWYQRDYIRVDWSQNLVTDPEFEEMWIEKIFGGVTLDPVQYYQTNPNDPDAPVMDTQHGYFDVSSHYVAQWAPVQLYGEYVPWLPNCLIVNLFTGSDSADCNDEEFTIRQSYMRVQDRDYEASETSGDKYTMFGTFTRTRYGYDRGYGVTDQNFHQYMVRQNVWQKSHTAVACGGANTDKATEDGKCGAGVCDMTAQKCTIPYTERSIRPVPYYLDATMPADLDGPNSTLVGEWNDAMKVAISTAREVECRDTKGGDPATCHSTYFADDGTPKTESNVVVMCHNPVIEANDPAGRTPDDPACVNEALRGADGMIRAREGDLRFNLIGWIDGDVQIGLLGYGPDGADPLTGEVIQSTAYIYGAAIDRYAAATRDIVAMANGDLAPDAFANGQAATDNVGSYVPNPKMADPTVFQRYSQYLQGKLDRRYDGALSDADIKTRLSGIDASKIVAQIGAASAMNPSATPAQRLATVNGLLQKAGDDGLAGFGGAAEAQAKLDQYSAQLAGSTSEQQIIDDPEFVLANAIGTTGDASLMAKAVSPFGVYGFLAMSNARDAFFRRLEGEGQCLFGTDEFNAPNVTGLALKLKNAYDFNPDSNPIPADCKQPADPTDPAQYADAARVCRQDKVFKWLRATIYRAVTEHEVGHTMSLRHNFQGSWDSINYNPNYWKLRTADGAHLNKICTTARDATKPDTCMGPRWLDPMTQTEIGAADGQSGIDEFQYSSIMDYGYDFNSDLHGLGQYDKAAMKFIYTGVVETFDSSVPSNVQDQLSPILASPITEQWMIKSDDGKNVQPIHYTKLAGKMNLFDASRCADSSSDDAVGGQVCGAPPKGHAFIRDMDSGEVVPGLFAAYYKNRNTGAIRWPYRFGSDEYSSYPQGLRFDAGADIYEGATQLNNLYEYRYVLDFYRRARRGWLPFLDFGSRLWGRYFSRYHSLGWLSALRTAQASAMYPGTTPDTNPALQSDDFGRGYALASTVLFEGLERSVLRPQPGGYQPKATDVDETRQLFEVPEFPTTVAKWNVGVLDGRYIDEVYDNNVGGSFNYLNYIGRMGTYAEKPIGMIAMSVLWPPEAVVTRDTYLDGRNVLLNFRSILPNAYDRLYAGVLGEDWDTVAPYVNIASAKKDPNLNVDGVNYVPLWTTDATRPSNVALVDPLVGYKVQGASIIYGLYFGTEDADNELPDSMRIWVEGGPEGVTVPASEKIILFEPESGITWAAHRIGTDTVDGKLVEKGIGARMLVHANALMAAAYKVQTDPATGLPLYDADGKVLWQAGVKPGTITDDASRDRFRKFVGVLNVERNAMWDFHY